MDQKKLYLPLICTLLLAISCDLHSRVTDRILEKAEALVEQYPDSALILLDSVQNPLDLEKEQRYRYILLQVQAKDKDDQDITSDTLIFKAKNYYSRAGDPNKAALSSLYAGRVLKTQKKYEQAIKAYLNAEHYSGQTENANLKGLIQSSIGAVYYDQLLKEEAIRRFKPAGRYFHQSGNYRNEIVTFNQIGNCFLLQGKNDSAFVYYKDGLALADQYGLVKEQSAIRQSIGVACRQVGDFQGAKLYFRQALSFSVDSLELSRLYCNLAKVFDKEGKTDSARYYIEQSIEKFPEGRDNYLAVSIYGAWSAIEEKDKNYPEALAHQKQYSKYMASILDENKSKAILELQRKYDLQLLQRYNEKLWDEKQQILLITSLVLLFIVILFLFVSRRSIRRKKELLEAEQKIYQLREMARSSAQSRDKKESSFRNALLEHFDILKKAALLETYIKKEEKEQAAYLIRK